jgi:hypothetical protein
MLSKSPRALWMTASTSLCCRSPPEWECAQTSSRASVHSAQVHHSVLCTMSTLIAFGKITRPPGAAWVPCFNFFCGGKPAPEGLGSGDAGCLLPAFFAAPSREFFAGASSGHTWVIDDSMRCRRRRRSGNVSFFSLTTFEI